MGADASGVQKKVPMRSELRALAGVQQIGKHRGCSLDGSVEVARAGGAIRLHVMHHDPSRLVVVGGFVGKTRGESREGPAGQPGPNVTHVVHDFGFGPFEHSPGTKSNENPLAGTIFTSHEGSGQVRYALKVVPMAHRRVGGGEIKTHTFSSNRGFLGENAAMQQASTSRRWLGVEFVYDFSPVMLRYSESRKSFFEFLTSVCAIVGGIYAVSGLLVQGWHGVSRTKLD